MKKKQKPVRGIDWHAILKRNPELQPPGYQETIDRLYPKNSND